MGLLWADPQFTVVGDLFTYLSTVTGGMFGVFAIASVFVMMFIGTVSRVGVPRGLMFSGSLSSVLAVLGAGFGLVPIIAVAPFVLITAFGIMIDRKGDG